MSNIIVFPHLKQHQLIALVGSTGFYIEYSYKKNLVYLMEKL